MQLAFDSMEKRGPCETGDPDVKWAYNEWLGGRDSDKADRVLRTEYHEVEKMTNSLAIKW